MPRIAHSRWKRGRLFFRRKVPPVLRDRIGRTEIIRAISSEPLSHAKRSLCSMWLKTEEIFTMLMDDPSITKEQIDQIVASLRGDCEYADEVRLAKTGGLFDHAGDAPLDADAIVLETHAEEYRSDLARNEIQRVRDDVQKRAAALGFKIDAESIDERLVGRAVLKEYIRSYDDAAAQARERFAYLYPDLNAQVEEPLAGASQPPSGSTEVRFAFVSLVPTSPVEGVPAERDNADGGGAPGDPTVLPTEGKFAPVGETMLELYDKFKSEKAADAKPDTWDQNRKIVKRFFEFIGETSHVSAITRKSVRDWKQALASWPEKAAQIRTFRGLSFRTIIEANELIKRPTISRKTVNKYLAALASFAKWLLTNEYIDNEVMSGMYLSVDKNKKNVLPFKEQQLQTIFSSPLFGKCRGDGHEHEKGNFAIRDWRYWVPWIALYSGSRLGEIAQLSTIDIRELHGVWIFHITEEGATEEGDDLKSTKTGGSQRVVPVHSELIKLGLLKYHAEMVARGKQKLFPQLKRDSRGFFGAASKFFNGYFEALGVKVDKKLNFHSLRHSVTDAFRRGGYLDEEFNVLLGHTKRTTTGIYGILPQGVLSQRVEMIEAVRYSGL